MKTVQKIGNGKWKLTFSDKTECKQVCKELNAKDIEDISASEMFDYIIIETYEAYKIFQTKLPKLFESFTKINNKKS